MIKTNQIKQTASDEDNYDDDDDKPCDDDDVNNIPWDEKDVDEFILLNEKCDADANDDAGDDDDGKSWDEMDYYSTSIAEKKMRGNYVEDPIEDDHDISPFLKDALDQETIIENDEFENGENDLNLILAEPRYYVKHYKDLYQRGDRLFEIGNFNKAKIFYDRALLFREREERKVGKSDKGHNTAKHIIKQKIKIILECIIDKNYTIPWGYKFMFDEEIFDGEENSDFKNFKDLIIKWNSARIKFKLEIEKGKKEKENYANRRMIAFQQVNCAWG